MCTAPEGPDPIPAGEGTHTNHIPFTSREIKKIGALVFRIVHLNIF